MPTPITLDILLVENYSPYTLTIADFSTYPTGYTPVSPTMQITPTGFPTVTLDFTPQANNTYTSENLGMSCVGTPLVKLLDGIYKLKYTINPAYQYFVEKTILKVDNIQEKFDTAFMTLDMMQCDEAIKKQRKVELDTIYYFIQGAIAAANKCADQVALRLYGQANRMLDNFITNKCNCNGYGNM